MRTLPITEPFPIQGLEDGEVAIRVSGRNPYYLVLTAEEFAARELHRAAWTYRNHPSGCDLHGRLLDDNRPGH
jgi:hypothetical protein